MNQTTSKDHAAGKSDAPPPESPIKPPLAPDQGPVQPRTRGVKMWHPEADCHIALTNGETMIVPHDEAGIEVIARFRPQAIALGCLPVGMQPEDDGAEPKGFDRKRVIKSAIEKMLASDEDGLFLGDGKPNVTKLSARVGFTVDRSEANAVWEEMQKADEDGDETISTEGGKKPAAKK